MSPFSSPESNGFWNASRALQHAALVTAGVWNAVYFARRAAGTHGSRRTAAGILCGLFAGIALQAASAAGGAESLDVALRIPLVAAVLATTAIVIVGGRR